MLFNWIPLENYSASGKVVMWSQQNQFDSPAWWEQNFKCAKRSALCFSSPKCPEMPPAWLLISPICLQHGFLFSVRTAYVWVCWNSDSNLWEDKFTDLIRKKKKGGGGKCHSRHHRAPWPCVGSACALVLMYQNECFITETELLRGVHSPLNVRRCNFFADQHRSDYQAAGPTPCLDSASLVKSMNFILSWMVTDASSESFLLLKFSVVTDTG